MLTRGVRAAQGVAIRSRGEGSVAGGSFKVMLAQDGLIAGMANEFGNRIL
jgi:hypothetical protein